MASIISISSLDAEDAEDRERRLVLFKNMLEKKGFIGCSPLEFQKVISKNDPPDFVRRVTLVRRKGDVYIGICPSCSEVSDFTHAHIINKSKGEDSSDVIRSIDEKILESDSKISELKEEKESIQGTIETTNPQSIIAGITAFISAILLYTSKLDISLDIWLIYAFALLLLAVSVIIFIFNLYYRFRIIWIDKRIKEVKKKYVE